MQYFPLQICNIQHSIHGGESEVIFMETIAKVSRLYHKEALSIRAIALKLNLNRRTVKKHIEQTLVPTYQKPAKH